MLERVKEKLGEDTDKVYIGNIHSIGIDLDSKEMSWNFKHLIFTYLKRVIAYLNLS